MKKTIIFGSILAVLLVAGTVVYQKLGEEVTPGIVEEEVIQHESVEARPAPNFNMLKFEGGVVNLEDFIGEKPVVLNFWASTCPPCVYEMPTFQQSFEKHEDVQFVMVNILGFNGETQQSARQFIDENNYTMPVFHEANGEASKAYGLTSIPRTLFINKKGEIIFEQNGMMEEKVLTEGINALLNEGSD